MAVRKKAKPKRKKAPARRPAVRKKAAKKPAKRAPVRRAAPKARKPAARRAAKPVPVSPAALPPPGERIGVITHYFSHLAVAVVKLEGAKLRVGDTIHIRGHTTDFEQRVDSLQVNHESVPEVGPRDDFGLKVREHAREHDVVYKVT